MLIYQVEVEFKLRYNIPMKICYKCSLKKRYFISQPQMLISYRGCDECKRMFVSSWNEEEVLKQMKCDDCNRPSQVRICHECLEDRR
jgi:hypothetical protein